MDEVNQAYKYEMAPNRQEIRLMRNWCGASRFIYNWGLALKSAAWNERKEKITQYDLQKRWTRERPDWAVKIPRRIMEAALIHLERAFQNFFAKRADYPRKKTRKSRMSFGYSGQARDGTELRVVREECKVKLPVLGMIKIKETPRIKGRILSATVSSEGCRWFVSFNVARSRNSPGRRTGSPVGVSLGIAPFATINDGTVVQEVEAPRPLDRSLRKIQRLNRKLSRRVDGSHNWYKARDSLRKAHYRVACVRKSFIDGLTSELTKNHSVVCIQALKVKHIQDPYNHDPGWISNRKLRRLIGDMGWYMFRQRMEYKGGPEGKWYGGLTITADPDFPSAKTCSKCGNVKETFPLHIRTYVCERCGLSLKRGINTSLNLLNYIKPSTARQAGT